MIVVSYIPQPLPKKTIIIMMMMMIKKTKDTDRANFDRGMKKMKIAMQTKREWHFIITFLVPLMHNEVKLKVNDGPSFSVYASVA